MKTIHILAMGIATACVLGLSGVATTFATSAAPVDLLSASGFAILSKADITDVPSSIITGNIGASPITGAAIGVSCPEVTGTIYSVDAAGPACEVIDASRLTTAVSDMESVYTSIAGRPLPTATGLGAGDISGLTISPGLYKWSTNVLISTNVTLSGGVHDVWVFIKRDGFAAMLDHLAPDREPDGDPVLFHRGE